jgi:outer membrane protein assembly factor BamB
MKLILAICTVFLTLNLQAEEKKLRFKIGPTVNAPIKYDDSIIFLSTSGILYKSKNDFSKLEKIYSTKQSTVSDITIDSDIAFFGEGLHDTENANLYAIDLKAKKLRNSILLKGHIQRPLTIENDILYVGHGPGGISALDKKTLKLKWNLTAINKKKLHVDSSPIIVGDDLCFNSIYDLEAFICIDKKSQKTSFIQEFKESPKMMLSQIGGKIIGATTKADLMKSKFDIPSTLFIYDTKLKKITFTKELRGFNFFPPTKIDENNFLITLSTGDILTFDLTKNKIGFVGEFPEPFISNPFIMDKNFCAIGIMGQLLCYEKGKTQYHISRKKRYFESPIGMIKEIDGKIYVPSRIGFFHL